MNSFEILILCLATYRLSYLLVHEPGPADIILRFRKLIGIEHDEDKHPLIYPPKFLPELFSCIFCMSIWVAIFFVLVWLFLAYVPKYLIVMPFAVSGGAVLIDSLIHRG